MAVSWLGTSVGHIDPIWTLWLWQRVMYDLCTRPEQPKPASAHIEMENHQEPETLGRMQQELRRSEEQDNKQHGLLDKAVPTTANITSASLLGKRHHSLYANLNGFEAEGICKVRVVVCPVPFLLVDMAWKSTLHACKVSVTVLSWQWDLYVESAPHHRLTCVCSTSLSRTVLWLLFSSQLAGTMLTYSDIVPIFTPLHTLLGYRWSN